MKSIKYVISMLLLSSFFVSLYAQNEPAVPSPPEVPDEPERHSYWEFSEQEEQSYLKDLDAELKLKLKEIKKKDEERYAELLRELHWRRMENHYMPRGRDKQRMELEREIVEAEIRIEALAITYNESPSEETKAELAKNVGLLFDQKEKQRQWEVNMLESEIEKLKQKIVSRKKNKEVIVRRRVEELLGVEEDLEWD